MLSVVVSILAAFGLLIGGSYRRARQRAEGGEAFAPAGKLRWDGRK